MKTLSAAKAYRLSVFHGGIEQAKREKRSLEEIVDYIEDRASNNFSSLNVSAYKISDFIRKSLSRKGYRVSDPKEGFITISWERVYEESFLRRVLGKKKSTKRN